jgi:hypothetical protein
MGEESGVQLEVKEGMGLRSGGKNKKKGKKEGRRTFETKKGC